jgi:hypothetical protein
VGTPSNPLDLQQLNANNLADCLRKCDDDPDCRAVTYSYVPLDELLDNCWLKTATTPSKVSDEKDTVNTVSVFKSEPEGFQPACKTCEEIKADVHACEWMALQLFVNAAIDAELCC